MDARIRFLPSGKTAWVPAGTTLLAAAREAGLPMASACGAHGLCARCGVRVLAGAEALSPEQDDERRAKARNRIDPAQRLACRARVSGDVELTATYW